MNSFTAIFSRLNARVISILFHFQSNKKYQTSQVYNCKKSVYKSNSHFNINCMDKSLLFTRCFSGTQLVVNRGIGLSIVALPSQREAINYHELFSHRSTHFHDVCNVITDFKHGNTQGGAPTTVFLTFNDSSFGVATGLRAGRLGL